MAEREERTIHRLEAFSDVVMGFALAELGLNLVVPKDSAGLVQMWAGLQLFCFSFCLIAMLWWFHHKLFVTYFTLNTFTVITNFTMLGLMSLGIYCAQVAGHFMIADVLPFVPLQLFAACWSAVYLLLAVMYGVGLWTHKTTLTHQDVEWGVNRTYRLVVGTALLALIAVTLPSFRHAGTLLMAVLAAVGVVAVLRRIAVPRITQALLQR